MNVAESTQQSALPTLLKASAAVDAWRSITRAHVIAALLFGFAVFLIHEALSHTWEDFSDAKWLMQVFVTDQIGAWVLMFALVVADRITAKDSRRRTVYALAAVISAAATAILVSLAYQLIWNQFEWKFATLTLSPTGTIFRMTGTFYVFLEWVIFGGAATLIYVDRRRAQAELAHMRNAELERTRTAKRELESRLQAMQARVEPQFLFNTLAQVKQFYELDLPLAERVLGDLIAYLRAAMPQMRDTTSTLAQEIELARSYLAILKIRLGDRLDYTIGVPESAGSMRFPPMMLLPLIDHAIAHGVESAEAGGSIGIRAEPSDARLRITIVEIGAGFAPESAGDGITSIRERLTALYGANARLDLHTGVAGTTKVVMEIPFESTAGAAELAE